MFGVFGNIYIDYLLKTNPKWTVHVHVCILSCRRELKYIKEGHDMIVFIPLSIHVMKKKKPIWTCVLFCQKDLKIIN